MNIEILNGLIVVVLGYLLGGFCTGYYLVRFRTGRDIRESGSGNVGAKNAGRALGSFGFAATFAGDAVKGAFPVWLAGWAVAGPWWPALCLLAVVCGHLYPAQLRFKGGKGISTMFGALLVLDWKLALLLLGFVLVLLAITRMFTVCGLLGVAMVPIVAVLLDRADEETIVVTAAVVPILLAHKRNIAEAVRSFRKGRPDKLA